MGVFHIAVYNYFKNYEIHKNTDEEPTHLLLLLKLSPLAISISLYICIIK